jgi:hypothetical protein
MACPLANRIQRHATRQVPLVLCEEATPLCRVFGRGRPEGTGSSGARISEKLPARARTEIGSAAHADWMRRASRISRGERPAGRGVERSFGGWFGSGDSGGETRMVSDRSTPMSKRENASRDSIGRECGVQSGGLSLQKICAKRLQLCCSAA